MQYWSRASVPGNAAEKETEIIAVGANATRFATVDLALVDLVDDATVQEGDCQYFERVDRRSVSERVEIASVGANARTVTLTTPLHWTFQSAAPCLAQIARVTPPIVKWAGVQALALQGGTNPGYNG